MTTSCSARSSTNVTNPAVHSPIHWPAFRYRWERYLNKKLLLRSLARILLGPPAPVAVLTGISVTADLADAHPELNWVYFCSDDFAEWPDLDGETLLRMEIELLPSMRTIAAVSENLQRRFQKMGYQASLITAGVDLDFWRDVVRDPRHQMILVRSRLFGD